MLDQKAFDTKLLTAETIPLTTSSLSHLASASATLYRCGNIGLVQITATNTSSALSVGSNATFNITDLPTLKSTSNSCGYSGATAMAGGISQTGAVTLRATGAAWEANYGSTMAFPVILA